MNFQSQFGYFITIYKVSLADGVTDTRIDERTI